MRHPFRLRHAVTLVSAVGLTLTSAGAASAAPAPGWRIVKTFGPAGGVWSPLFAASGPRNAWSEWAACICSAGNRGVHRYLEESAGGSWRRVRLPSQFLPALKATVAVATSSASNTWLFTLSPGKETVLRWNGASWRAQTIPSWVLRPNLGGTIDATPLVFSSTSAWVFSRYVDAFSHPDHYVARYARGRWSKVTLPGIPEEVSALSPSDIWALAASLKGNHSAQLLMHWNGKRWHTVPVPKAHVPAGATESVHDLALTGPSGIWLQRDIEQGSNGARTLYLLHWNGTSWRRVKLAAGITGVDYLAQDGHGGLWAAANGPGPGYQWRMYHVSSGRWTRYALPTVKGTSLGDLLSLTWIPGTRSMWATGNMMTPPSVNTVVGAILKYGR